MNLTLKMAKENFFDPKAILSAAEKGKRKILVGFGATCRKIAKNSIKTGPDDKHSAPGQAPIGHNGKTRYKDFIFFFHDKDTDEVITGAVLLPRKDKTIVPGALEKGGLVDHRKFSGSGGNYQVVTTLQAARPHMKPAFDKTVEKFLPGLIENSIVKE